MIQKNINEITEEDLQSLIDNSISEHKTIDYKQSLSISSDRERKEFLADITSFSNASGGDLIYGMSEKNGKPKKIEGLNIENIDAEILKLESMIRDCIEPRILGIVSQPIKLSDSSKKVLIIRIPKSWNSPHRVSFKGHNKFYSRSTNGKYELDVGELRIAFNLSETITERIKKFRENRISKIFANETPIPFDNNAKIVFHLIPISSFYPAQNYDISNSSIRLKMIEIHNKYDEYLGERYNLDGFLTYSFYPKAKSANFYIQLFKNGIIEVVNGLVLNYYRKLIPSIAYEKELVESLPICLSILKTLKVELPVFVFLTLLGVKGYKMALTNKNSRDEIDRDPLVLSEVVIESYDVLAGDVLKPCFDSIWNACGHSRSLNYDKNGKWKG